MIGKSTPQTPHLFLAAFPPVSPRYSEILIQRMSRAFSRARSGSREEKMLSTTRGGRRAETEWGGYARGNSTVDRARSRFSRSRSAAPSVKAFAVSFCIYFTAILQASFVAPRRALPSLLRSARSLVSLETHFDRPSGSESTRHARVISLGRTWEEQPRLCQGSSSILIEATTRSGEYRVPHRWIREVARRDVPPRVIARVRISRRSCSASDLPLEIRPLSLRLGAGSGDRYTLQRRAFDFA